MLVKAASNGIYTLVIEYDDDPLNPRVDYDNFGKMICFHRRYNLGDKHEYKEPDDFLSAVMNDPAFAKPVYDYIRQDRSRDVRLEYSRTDREWQLSSYWDFAKRWGVDATFPPGLDRNHLPQSFLDDALAALPMAAKLEILDETEGFIIQPLFLYDHSGLTISTSPYSCRWDSGQVGWVYADRKMIEKEYGVVTKETIAKAETLLESEVKCYDLYLTGQCYGFRLYEDECEVDSCWGFLGDLDDLADELRSYLPEECRCLIDELSACRESSIAEYFWNLKHKAS